MRGGEGHDSSANINLFALRQILSNCNKQTYSPEVVRLLTEKIHWN